jgi:hypothetical protein
MLKFFRRLFDFHKPMIIDLEWIGLVVENKRLLLLCWQFGKDYRLSVPLLNKSWKGSSNAIVVKLPTFPEKLTVVIKSWWRRRTILIELKETALDPQSAATLIDAFRPFQIPGTKIQNASLRLKTIVPVSFLPKLTLMKPAILFAIPTAKIPLPSIKKDKMIFNTQLPL